METTRDKLIQNAIRQIAKKGFEETSFQNLADHAGLSQSAVLYHFKSKEGLLTEVLKMIIEHNHEIVSAKMKIDDSAVDRLQKHFEGNIEWAVKHKDEAQILVLLYYMACFHKGFAQKYSEILSTARKRIEEHIHAARREGTIKSSASPAELSRTLHDTLVGGFINTITIANSEKEVQDIKVRWTYFFNAMFGIK